MRSAARGAVRSTSPLPATRERLRSSSRRLPTSGRAFADPNEHGAYRVSEAHFVQCHLRHVWLFRLVKKRFPFLRLCVRDDGEFWQNEDVDLLLSKVQVYAVFLNLVADNLRENGCEVIVPGEEATPHQ
jgi:hypothetical protein